MDVISELYYYTITLVVLSTRKRDMEGEMVEEEEEIVDVYVNGDEQYDDQKRALEVLGIPLEGEKTTIRCSRSDNIIMQKERTDIKY